VNAGKRSLALSPTRGTAMAPPGPAIQTTRLTKRYRRVTALSDCSVTVPEGSICALVGPNGAGKTTLLRMLCGLSEPTAGTASVLGAAPRQAPEFLAQVGFLAQEMPLYRRMTAQDHIAAGAHLNARWDGASVRDRLRSLSIPLDRAVGTLSGGQRSQVALALVSLTVMLSSHLIADIERVCDHLVLLAASHVQLCGDTDELLAEHKILIGPKKDTAPLGRTHTVVQETTAGRQATLLVRLGGPLIDPAYQAEDVGLEELVLGYMGSAAPAAYARPASADLDERFGEGQ
jgi:ABC-2 type transport system ATP-binding protein